MCNCGNKQPRREPEMTRIIQQDYILVPMKEYVVGLNWQYIGLCGCKTNKEMYTNVSYPNVQIWITKAGDVMQIRRKWSGPDSQVKAVATKTNYVSVYDWWIVQNHIRI